MQQIDIFQDGISVSRVFIGDDPKCSGDLGNCLSSYAHVYVVADRQVVMKSHTVHTMLQDFIHKGFPVKVLDVSETLKSMDSVLDICSWLLDEGADRDALVLAVGGGITTDMTGFAASIYKRGVRFAYIPTTLLSQVDAAIGGKTGVNFEKYKNILGVIRQPEFTYMCAQVLESLPKRDFLSGAAEMLKTFVIEDKGMYVRTVNFLKSYAENPEKTMAECCDELRDLIAAAASVKAGVVSRDQFERGERRVLNLGHTFAHAIETLAQRGIGEMIPLNLNKPSVVVTHGEAVAMGLVLAARLSENLAKADHGLAARLETDMKACGLPVDCPYSISEMADVMKKDKKAEGGKVHFVLPCAVGKVEIVDLAVDEVIKLMK